MTILHFYNAIFPDVYIVCVYNLYYLFANLCIGKCESFVHFLTTVSLVVSLSYFSLEWSLVSKALHVIYPPLWFQYYVDTERSKWIISSHSVLRSDIIASVHLANGCYIFGNHYLINVFKGRIKCLGPCYSLVIEFVNIFSFSEHQAFFLFIWEKCQFNAIG